jgi:ADP-ribosylglycohydrolase
VAATERAVVGCLLGTAVGDALGLCGENLSPRRRSRLFPDLERYSFLPGKGLCSDDTEHACLTAQALLVSGGEPDGFQRDLARRLRWWLLGLPAGIGRATLLAIFKLWLGFSPQRSGIFSAGNGPAMRAPLLGVCFGHDRESLRQLVRASTRLTHTDPKAEYAALVVALAAWQSSQCDTPVSADGFVQTATELLGPEAEKLLALLRQAAQSATRGETTTDFARGLGLARGVTGYVYHTVPVVVQAWLRHPDDYRAAILSVLECGGDSDTTAAILGGIVGARVGKDGIPERWLANLWEWPRTVAWMERLGQRLAAAPPGQPRSAEPVNLPGLFVRNLAFFALVLAHVVRRWFPPY